MSTQDSTEKAAKSTEPTEVPENTQEQAPEGPPSTLDMGFSMHLDEKTQELWVSFEPTKRSRELTNKEFQELIEEAGYPLKSFPLIPQNLSVLLDSVRRRQPKDICISIPLDASVEIFFNPGKLLAGAVLKGAQGRGKALDQEQLNQALKKNKVTHGLVDEALKELVSEEINQRLHNTEDVYCTVIAYGEKHENGIDGYLEVLIKDASDRRAQIDDYGTIDYLEKGDFPLLEENTPLMRRHPPTKGKLGQTVQGKTIRAKDGKDVQFKIKDSSVTPAKEDENLLLAAAAGLPVINERGVHIEQVLKLDKVDIGTGHVRYRGSVEIKGDVRDGMQVIATGDIKVGGVVDAAFIKAGGHIEAMGGVIGHAGNDKQPQKATLLSECSIKARFAHEAQLQAKQDIVIGNQVMHSKLIAGASIFVQGKGQVAGGSLKAADLLEMNTSGAVAYTKTHLEVGESAKLQKRFTELLNQLNEIDEKKDRLIELARKTRQAGKEELAKKKDQLIKAKESLQTYAARINTEMHEVEEQLKRFYAAKIKINRSAYPGTHIVIAGHPYEINKEMDRVTFVLRDDKVVIE